MSRHYNDRGMDELDDAPYNAGSRDAPPVNATALTQEALREIRDLQEARDNGKQVADYKLLGLISMPAEMGAILKPALNLVQGRASLYFQKFSHWAIENHGTKIGIPQNRLQMTSQLVSVAGGASVMVADDAMQLWKGFSHYKREATKTAGDIAPVLSDLKIKPGFFGILGVTAEQNELIYAHRNRLAQGLSLNTTRTTIGAAAKVPQLYNIIQQGLSTAGIKIPTPAFIERIKKADMQVNNNALQFNGSEMFGGVLSSAAEMYNTKLERAYNKANKTPSALELIVDLAKQLKDDPRGDSFVIKGSGQDVSLTQYVALTIKAHQEDMARIDTDATPLRKGLDEELLSISSRVADSIHKGELAPLMLIRLIGEHQIVKNKGRALAKLPQIEKAIAAHTGHTESYRTVDQKEFYDAGGFTEADVKKTLDVLSGKERSLFLASLPQNVAMHAGISEKDYRAAQDIAAADHHRTLAEGVVGLSANDNKHASELTDSEQQVVAAAAQEVAENGHKAIGKFTANVAGDSNGVDTLLQRAVIEGVKSGKPHVLKDLVNAGKKSLAAQEGEGFKGKEDARRRDSADSREVSFS
jgi:hypothetical protein